MAGAYPRMGLLAENSASNENTPKEVSCKNALSLKLGHSLLNETAITSL
ncbi:hypothetical protein [Aestuariirhabdus litorea]|nr:hypothetical protein [Aestuariirhabdus litorea]